MLTSDASKWTKLAAKGDGLDGTDVSTLETKKFHLKQMLVH